MQPELLEEFVDRVGSSVLSKKQGKQRIVSFERLTLLIQGHILEENHYNRSVYKTHPCDKGSLEDTQNLHVADFAKLTTGIERYSFQPTLHHSANATILVDTPPQVGCFEL